MTPQPEADRNGAVVLDAAAPLWTPPYDVDLALSADTVDEDFALILGDRGFAHFSFEALEPDPDLPGQQRMVDNTIGFEARGIEYLLTREDIHAAMRGDVNQTGIAVVRERRPWTGDRMQWRRQLLVTYPRPGGLSRDEITQRVTAHRREIARQAEINRARWEVQDKQKKAAYRVAKETLQSFLTPEQRETVRTGGFFEIVGSHGTRYLIRTDDYSGNVRIVTRRPDRRFTGGFRLQEIAQFCGHCDQSRWVPVPDHNLAQMLELVTDEVAWLRTAVKQYGAYPAPYYLHATSKMVEEIAYFEKAYRDAGKDPELAYTRACHCADCIRDA